MSGRAVGHVYRYSPFDGTTQLVLLAIADTVNDTYGNRFFASQATLATKARVARSSVQRAIKELTASDWIKPVRGRAGTPGWDGDGDWGGVNSYQFMFPADLPVYYDDGRDPDAYRPDGRAIPTRSEDLPHHDASPVDPESPHHEASTGQKVAPPSGNSEPPTCPTTGQGLPHHEATTCLTMKQGCPTMVRDNSIELNVELNENTTTTAPAAPGGDAAVAEPQLPMEGAPPPGKARKMSGKIAKARAKGDQGSLGGFFLDWHGISLWGASQADALHALWAAVFDRDYEPPSKATSTMYDNAVKAYGFEECAHAIRGMEHAHWHREHGFDMPSKIFTSDPKKFLMYVEWGKGRDPMLDAPSSARPGYQGRRAPGQHHGPTGVLPELDAYDEMARTWGQRR